LSGLDKLDALLRRVSLRLWTRLCLLKCVAAERRRYPILELETEQRRQKTLDALTAQLEALSRSNPVLMIFEDVHWLDPTSLEVVGRTVDRLKTLAALVIVTHRPEFEPPWIGLCYLPEHQPLRRARNRCPNRPCYRR
jgi:predicted ATPase